RTSQERSERPARAEAPASALHRNVLTLNRRAGQPESKAAGLSVLSPDGQSTAFFQRGATDVDFHLPHWPPTDSAIQARDVPAGASKPRRVELSRVFYTFRSRAIGFDAKVFAANKQWPPCGVGDERSFVGEGECV